MNGTFFCNKCGAQNAAGAQFCSRCGAPTSPTPVPSASDFIISRRQRSPNPRRPTQPQPLPIRRLRRGGGSWLRRILDSGGCRHHRHHHFAGCGGSGGHDFRRPRAGGRNDGSRSAFWTSFFWTWSFGRWRHFHLIAFRILVVRGFHGKLVVPGDAGQDDLRDEGYRSQRQPHLVRTRDGKAFCEVAFRDDPVHRLHHGRIHGAQTGTARSCWPGRWCGEDRGAADSPVWRSIFARDGFWRGWASRRAVSITLRCWSQPCSRWRSFHSQLTFPTSVSCGSCLEFPVRDAAFRIRS